MIPPAARQALTSALGERVTFAAGETSARVQIDIMSPTENMAGVSIEELRIRVDWMGDRVLVREILRVKNPGEQVIQVLKEPLSGHVVLEDLLLHGASGPSRGQLTSGVQHHLVEERDGDIDSELHIG